MSGVFLQCNACWSALEGKAVATACQHLFCLRCAQQIVENSSGCTICDAVITKSTMKMVASLQDASALQLLLCGQAPEAAFASAAASVQFYVAQQRIQAELREAQLNKKVTKVQDACRKKLAEVHNAYTQAKRKYEEVVSSKEQAQQDAQELQAKYAQKSMQARKLQEMLKKTQEQMEALQHENNALRQNMAKGLGPGGGSGGGRSLSPLAQGAVVTTVQRTAQLYTTSPTNVVGYGNAIQQSSGRVQGITGGYRATSGGHGGVGRILGGSLDPNSPGGVLPSVSQGAGRTGSDTSFGLGLAAGPRHGGGPLMPAQDPHNNALRKMLGMKTMGGAGRDAGIRSDFMSF